MIETSNESDIRKCWCVPITMHTPLEYMVAVTGGVGALVGMLSNYHLVSAAVGIVLMLGGFVLLPLFRSRSRRKGDRPDRAAGSQSNETGGHGYWLRPTRHEPVEYVVAMTGGFAAVVGTYSSLHVIIWVGLVLMWVGYALLPLLRMRSRSRPRDDRPVSNGA